MRMLTSFAKEDVGRRWHDEPLQSLSIVEREVQRHRNHSQGQWDDEDDGQVHVRPKQIALQHDGVQSAFLTSLLPSWHA